MRAKKKASLSGHRRPPSLMNIAAPLQGEVATSRISERDETMHHPNRVMSKLPSVRLRRRSRTSRRTARADWHGARAWRQPRQFPLGDVGGTGPEDVREDAAGAEKRPESGARPGGSALPPRCAACFHASDPAARGGRSALPGALDHLGERGARAMLFCDRRATVDLSKPLDSGSGKEGTCGGP